MPFKPGQSGNPYGRPPNDECFRPSLRRFAKMHPKDLAVYHPKTNEECAAKRAMLAITSEDGQAFDWRLYVELINQLDGKPNQPQTIDATIETKSNPIADAIDRMIESKTSAKNN